MNSIACALSLVTDSSQLRPDFQAPHSTDRCHSSVGNDHKQRLTALSLTVAKTRKDQGRAMQLTGGLAVGHGVGLHEGSFEREARRVKTGDSSIVVMQSSRECDLHGEEQQRAFPALGAGRGCR